MANYPCNKTPVRFISCCDVMDCIAIESSDNSVTVTKNGCGVDITQTGNNLDQILGLEDSGCITWVKEFIDGVLTYTPQLDLECVEAGIDIDNLITVANGTCISFTKSVVAGVTIYTPVLNIPCILAALVSGGICAACEEPVVQPEVAFDCEDIEVFGVFELGTPSTGFIQIPVTVVGSGIITVNISTLNGSLFGSTSQMVTSATTTISCPVYYTGGGSDGTIAITVTIDGVDVTIECDTDVVVEPGGDCIDVTLGAGTLPDGIVGTPYSYSIPLNGTAPFVLDTIVKPSWMTVAIVGSNVSFTGTPDADGTGLTVSFNVTNCVAGTDSFSETIDVTEEAPPEAWDTYFADMYICSNCGGGPVEEGVPVKLPVGFPLVLGKFYQSVLYPDSVFFISDPTLIPYDVGAVELTGANFTLCTSACDEPLIETAIQRASTAEDACESTGDVVVLTGIFTTSGTLSNGITLFLDAAGTTTYVGVEGQFYSSPINCLWGTVDALGIFTQLGICATSGYSCA